MKHDVFDQEFDVDFSVIDYDVSYSKELSLICGPFYHDLARIFPKRMAAYVLLTRRSRRRIWCAYLAASKDRLHLSHRTHEDLRDVLLYRSAKSLMQDAYGDLPEGFLGLIKSPAVDDLGPDGFMILHKLLSEGKVNPASLHGYKLTDDLLAMLDILPTEVALIKVAKMFNSKRNYDRFQNKISFMETVAGKPLRQNAYRGLLSGMKSATVVEHCLSHVTFPNPVLSPYGKIKHISTAAELFRAGRLFENCLQQKLEEALSGNKQFYIFQDANDHVVFAISRFTQTHWRLDEIQKNDEAFVMIEDIPVLATYLEQEDIHTGSSNLYRALTSIMRQ